MTEEETTKSLNLLEVGTSGVSGNSPDDQGGDEDNVGAGASTGESMRRDSLMPQEGGLIMAMEREAMEAGLGGWFNRNPEDIPESWSGSSYGSLFTKVKLVSTQWIAKVQVKINFYISPCLPLAQM